MSAIYGDKAHLYPLYAPRDDHAEEGRGLLALARGVLGEGPLRALELGCGAGHLVSWFEGVQLTLTDLSPQMLALAAEANPGARCVQGDMRTLRLGETFDLVLAHDALCFLLGEHALAAALGTARAHVRPGGLALFVPDFFTETFAPDTEVDGSDAEGQCLRVLGQVWQRSGQADRYVVDSAFMHRVGEAPPELWFERHEEGLFPREVWRAHLEALGFEVCFAPTPWGAEAGAILARLPPVP